MTVGILFFRWISGIIAYICIMATATTKTNRRFADKTIAEWLRFSPSVGNIVPSTTTGPDTIMVNA